MKIEVNHNSWKNKFLFATAYQFYFHKPGLEKYLKLRIFLVGRFTFSKNSFINPYENLSFNDFYVRTAHEKNGNKKFQRIGKI